MVTEEQKAALIAAAQQIQSQAYAPYSNYLVGSAVLGSDGNIYSSVNIENASYGLTVCAERNAIFKMVSAGVTQFLAIAVCGEGQGSPCGACRQVMVEFADDVPIYLTSSRGDLRETSTHALLPMHFGPNNLTIANEEAK